MKVKSLFLLIVALLLNLPVFSQNARMIRNKQQSREKNHDCFKCHSSQHIKTDSGDIHLEKSDIVDTNIYYSSIHGGFSCTDCHSEDFNIQPHKVTIKDDVFPTCMDCHEGNKKTALYQFEKIAEAYDKSIHAKKMTDEFTCWKCHDPHGYKNLFGISDSIGFQDMIEGQNLMCLKCHGNKVDSGKKKWDMVKSHNWLPQMDLHFQHIRCIDCHAVIPDSIHVSHLITPATVAIRNCLACHSANSYLLGTLYKYHRSLKKQSRFGFMNNEILENSYVMGANRNRFLNIASILIFGLVIATIIIHALVRVILKKKK